MTTRNAAIKNLQGFDVRVLASQAVELAVVPELGARIVSLKNLQTDREWLWRPEGDLKLFRNHPLDDFASSPLAGLDECIPTILPCTWRGRALPDHGEVWSQPWQVDEPAWREGVLTTSVQLPTSPLIFQRTIELHGREVRFIYHLSNLNPVQESFIWAFHPLLRLEPGDVLELPASTRKLLNSEAWLDSLASAMPANGCAKVFASPISEGWAAINNRAAADRLQLAWNPEQNKTLGLWLNRGGWHGHHHFALEPTNANHDSLAVAAEHGTVAGKRLADMAAFIARGGGLDFDQHICTLR